MLTRRHALALGAAGLAFPAAATGPLRVLFIGNSFTFEHDLPQLFADIARQAGHDVHVDMIAEGGAHLADNLVDRDVFDLVDAYDPQMLVLQDFSTVALLPETATQSRRAFAQFCRLPVPRILFATWARQEGHKLYRQVGMPATPAEMTSLTHQHYTARVCPDLAAHRITKTAAVGRAWSLGDGLPLHREDGYHASLTGAWLSALVLARTAGLAPDTPVAPDGVASPGRLIQIARLAAP